MKHIILFALMIFIGCMPANDSVQTGGAHENLQWKPDATSAFEVGTQLRPWTIYDEGMTNILDNVQSMAGVNNIYLIVVMHQEHRPFKAPEFPHNPARDIFDAEDSRVSFFPDMKRYGTIKPLLSDYDWIRETDWLQLVVDSCRARGLSVGAEVSHYPIPKKLVRDNPDRSHLAVRSERFAQLVFRCLKRETADEQFVDHTSW